MPIEEKNVGDPCHCGSSTAVYRTRKVVFTKGEGKKTYHRCSNCGYRFVETRNNIFSQATRVSIWDFMGKKANNDTNH